MIIWIFAIHPTSFYNRGTCLKMALIGSTVMTGCNS